MLGDYDLSDFDIRTILRWVHWMQTGWLILVGIALFIAPASRFGHSYFFIMAVPGLQYVYAALFLISGLVLCVSTIKNWQMRMGYSLLVGGITNGIFGLFLGAGAVAGPTGVLGSLFCFYIATHMVIQSVLLSRKPYGPPARGQ